MAVRRNGKKKNGNGNGNGKKKRGRPRAITAAKKKQALELMRSGAMDDDVAKAIGVHVSTLYREYVRDPDFCEAEKEQKAIWDKAVVRDLYLYGRGRLPIHQGCHQPNATAMIFWLKNRQPKEWRDKKDVNISTEQNLAAYMSTLAKEEADA